MIDHRMTIDEAVLRILLEDIPEADRQKKLSALAKVAKRAISGGDCPECERHASHMDNGGYGEDKTFCCESCGWQWDAVQP